MRVRQLLLQRITMGILVFIALLSVWVYAYAEIIYLGPVERRIEADPAKGRTGEELREIEQAKRFIIDFINSDPERKYRSTTSGFRIRRDRDFIKKVFNKESYAAIELLRFDVVGVGNARQLTVKANLHWFDEGYDGVQTFYFVLKRERDVWLLEWIVF